MSNMSNGSSKKPRRSFTPEFKEGAVKFVEEGKPVAQVARDLGIWHSTLAVWVERSRADKGKSTRGTLTTEEKEELVAVAEGEPRAPAGARDPKKSGGLLREGERVKFAFIAEKAPIFPISGCAGRSACLGPASMRGRRRPPCAHAGEDERLKCPGA